ncbi:PREDICTED: uncharacterized protein LOC109475603 isoform X1 [Branchiostoma belcheri]|uniref:Uncharacterized protein LOC109475603 isoform X1 n=1 Tax=Branchiostoma belcheri TaxID=7741 RepID=A0A6P4ZDA4_BRABE|nr:PREDICTED: uncharacterized protein LOC109475603 isoform X1 [Branchiostoma belcheri]
MATPSPELMPLWAGLAVCGSVLIATVAAVVTYCHFRHQSRRDQRLRARLDRVNQQLTKLWGPLYGNRLANHKAYAQALGTHSTLDSYLNDSLQVWQMDRHTGSMMLSRWRTFLFYVMYPLDLKAEEIIRNHIHLCEGHFPQGFADFLFHTNYLRIVLSHWQLRKDGTLDTEIEYAQEDDFYRENNGGFTFHYPIFDQLDAFVKDTYESLLMHQQVLMAALKEGDNGFVGTVRVNPLGADRGTEATEAYPMYVPQGQAVNPTKGDNEVIEAYPPIYVPVLDPAKGDKRATNGHGSVRRDIEDRALTLEPDEAYEPVEPGRKSSGNDDDISGKPEGDIQDTYTPQDIHQELQSVVYVPNN